MAHGFDACSPSADQSAGGPPAISAATFELSRTIRAGEGRERHLYPGLGGVKCLDGVPLIGALARPSGHKQEIAAGTGRDQDEQDHGE